MKRRCQINPKRHKPRRKGTPTPRIKLGRVEEPDHLDLVRALGCVICGARPAEAHHVRIGVGMGQKAGDDETIGLCAVHHRTGGFGVAYHAGPREWERMHGAQREHLARVLVILKPDCQG